MLCSTLLDVDITRLIHDQPLKDGTTHLHVVIVCEVEDEAFTVEAHVVLPDEFPDRTAIPCVVFENGSLQVRGVEYGALPSDDFFHRSWTRVRNIAMDHPVEPPIKASEFDSLVGIRATNRRGGLIWQGAGVFQSRGAGYLKTLRANKVHAMGRVALMHRTLFALVGVNSTTPSPFFKITDAWEGSAAVSHSEVLGCLDRAVHTIVDRAPPEHKEALRALLVGAARDAVPSADFYVPIDSGHLIAGVGPSVDRTKQLYPLFKILEHNGVEAQRYVETHELDDQVFPRFVGAKFKELLRQRMIELYVQRLCAKMTASAVIIGPVPPGVKVDGNVVTNLVTEHGIYGIFTAAENAGRASRYFKALPWAVANAFVDMAA